MTKPIELVPGSRSFVVGVTGIMARYDMGEHAAKRLLRDWYEEQQRGGPRRVFRKPHRGAHAYYTTEAELHAWMPHGRDLRLVRQVDRLERELEFERLRIDKLAARVAAVEARRR